MQESQRIAANVRQAQGLLLILRDSHMDGCQNYAAFLGTLNIRCRIIIGIQQGTIILTTTHIILVPAQCLINLRLAEL